MALRQNNPRYYDVKDLLAKLVPENVERVYAGKPGCMCGCKGTYSHSTTALEKYEDWQGKASDKAVKLAVDFMRDFLTSHTEEQLQAMLDRDDLSLATEFMCVDYESEKSSTPSTRRRAVYFKEKK